MDDAVARTPEKNALLRALWRDKLHTEPEAIEASPRAIRQTYDSIWQPSERLLVELGQLPTGLLSLWAASTRGHVVLTHFSSTYRPGSQSWRKSSLESVCYLALSDLEAWSRRPALVLFHLLDHLLGSDCRESGGRLSDGEGSHSMLRDVGQRFVTIEALGYGHDELRVQTRHDYFAHTLWLHLYDPEKLNVLDPLVFKLYANTLLDEGFWLRAGRDGRAHK